MFRFLSITEIKCRQMKMSSCSQKPVKPSHLIEPCPTMLLFAVSKQSARSITSVKITSF